MLSGLRRHCYMYKAVKRVLERQAARVLYRGEVRQTLPPIQEWRRFDATCRTCGRRGGSSWPSARAPRSGCLQDQNRGQLFVD